MAHEEDIHFRVPARFKMQVLDYVKKNNTTITDFGITAFRHEMYDRTDDGGACCELDLLQEYLDGRREELDHQGTSNDVSQVVSKTVSQPVYQECTGTQSVSQNEVDYMQIQDIKDVHNIPTAVAHIKFLQRVSFSQSVPEVEMVAERCGCTFKEFMKILEEEGINITWKY